MQQVRFGYSLWGFIGDEKMDENGKELSTPDGNATYSWSILHEAQKRGWQTFSMQDDRDIHAFRRLGSNLFSAFSQEKRTAAYLNTRQTHGWALPELDVLLIEWRWPIPGRNCSDVTSNGNVWFSDQDKLDPDLRRQCELLEHYSEKDTRIIIWDLDHKLTEKDETHWTFDAIFETSRKPRRLIRDRVGVEPPTVISDLLEHPTLPSDIHRKLVYVGSRYERDDVIEEWIKPVSERFPEQVEFWGNWTRPETLEECLRMWPNISYNGRITTKDFRKVYGTAVACPLLAKRSYLDTGFITPRPWEALMFGTIPVGLRSHLGVENYVNELCIAKDPKDLMEIVYWLSTFSEGARDHMRRQNVEQISFMDVKHFVDKIEAVL